MQNLIAAFSATKDAARIAAFELRKAFEALTLPEKMVIICGDGDNLFDEVLHSDRWYTGPGNVSLYDDFYWDRYETKTLSEVFDRVTDNLEESTGDETAEELAALIMADEGAKAQTLRDMVERNIGKARHEW